MNHYYLMYPSGSVDDYLFSDADNVTYIDAKGKKCHNAFSRIIKKVHLSGKINKIIPLPFRKKWYDLKELGRNKNDDYYCYILGSSFHYIDMIIIKKMFDKPNMHLRLILLDPYASNTPVPAITREALKRIQFEKIYTHDLIESRTYGFVYLDEKWFSNNFMKDIEVSNEYDLYFLGRFKNGRGDFIFDLAKYLHEKGVNFCCKMQITDVGLKDAGVKELDKDYITYFTDFITYKDVVKESAKSNCILELIQGTESDTTLRYFEAVMLNKKLLTNNNNIVNMKYYDPRYMKIFTSLEDIDIDWVRQKEEIDYHYKGDFSSKLFFENEINDIERRK